MEGHLSLDWFKGYQQYLIDGTPQQDYMLKDVLQGETLRRATRALPSTVMDSPVRLYENMSNQTSGSIRRNPHSPSGWNIAINGRLYHDPADIVPIIAEEAMHIARQLKGRSFDFSKPYDERPHEISAKKGAQYVSGGLTGLKHGLLLARQQGDLNSGE